MLDDGWFGNKYPRNSDKQGLGDWQINTKKLPNGIDNLVKETAKKGMKFGIWVEPEMVNPKSELYEAHPDWIIRQPNRTPGTQRNQYVLDLSNPQVQDFVFNAVDKILTSNPDIAYVKWDANSHFSDPGSAYLPQDLQQHIWIDYSKGLLSVFKRVADAHPHVIKQACASGGGRVDYATIDYFHEFWASDDTDAWQRIFIQWGTSHFFPAIAMAAHVSDVPNGISQRDIPLKFRFDVAMSGRLGLELQPGHMTPEEKAFSKKAIEGYKKIRDIVQLGDLYRLASPYEGDLSSLMYVSEDKDSAVVFLYQRQWHVGTHMPNIKLKGLQQEHQYSIKEINCLTSKSHFNKDNLLFSGDFLMQNGVEISYEGSNSALSLPFRSEYKSYVLLLEKE
ncbi:MAG: alpha-galactosidase [Bacteroidales bacterium]|nr:alpha-galactosidase [Bacteroidales bacterium]